MTSVDSMGSERQAKRDLVIANRALAQAGILDAFGHVSVRHPQRAEHFFQAWARAPELVEEADIIEFTLDGEPLDAAGRAGYLERFIHAAVYEQRPDIVAVCHNHTASILPFSISQTVRLRAVIHSAAGLGEEVPVWDIATEFGSRTNLLVMNMEQGRSLARALGSGQMALMRGHGSVVAAANLSQLVSLCVGMEKNARVQLQAMQMGAFTPLATGEINRPPPVAPSGPPLPDRAWEYWARRVGMAAG